MNSSGDDPFGYIPLKRNRKKLVHKRNLDMGTPWNGAMGREGTTKDTQKRILGDNDSSDQEILSRQQLCRKESVKTSSGGFNNNFKRKHKKPRTKFIDESVLNGSLVNPIATPPHHCTVTPLVRKVFEAVFSEQMIRNKSDNTEKTDVCQQCRKVGICVITMCGGKSKHVVENVCDSMVVKDDNEGIDSCSEIDEDSSNETDVTADTDISLSTTILRHRGKKKHKRVRWRGRGIKNGKQTFYTSAVLGDDLTITLGNTVLIEPTIPNTLPYVANIINMSDGPEGPLVHVQWFARGSDTILGDTADPTELFLITDCGDQPMLSVWKQCTVNMRSEPVQSKWKQLGGTEATPQQFFLDDGLTFWCQLWYGPENARFEYPKALPDCPPDQKKNMSFCGMCVRKLAEEDRWKPILGEKNEDGDYTFITWDRAPLKLGDTVYLQGGTFNLKVGNSESFPMSEEEHVDEHLYPEHYRKRKLDLLNNTPEPFQLGTIKKILKAWGSGEAGNVKLRVQIFYRPEDTHMEQEAVDSDYYNLVHWSEKEATVPFSSVTGRCWIKFAEQGLTDQELDVWTEEGPDRWFFREWYNSDEQRLKELPSTAIKIDEDCDPNNSFPIFPKVIKKLSCLDIFSGCGGFSHGLHQSGVADSKWAIEIFEPAARAYKLNNPDCTVFTDNCNVLLRSVIEGVKTDSHGQKMPKRGEVDLLCGGPPCQGFSMMNRFNDREYSQFKNSLVSTYLSYCDYYRPRFFILENVRNFVSFHKSLVLKLCIRTLVKMGYQCSFGILQAGQFGLAQTRRRVFLLAAAPGETLPLFPEPRHVFVSQACHLSVEIDKIRFSSNARWILAGPYMATNVGDVISDLPSIKNGASKLQIPYGREAKSSFQKKIRQGSEVLRDHITKRMAAMDVARVELIPTASGSDWRDLPNKVITLKDGTCCCKLDYSHDDVKQGKSETGSLRGVCSCADGNSKCDPEDNQQNTLIPWWLPHKANIHNNYAGVYGRVDWDGFFPTTTTNPEPSSKQGKVIHPDQNRILSVRELARSQGFPDTYKFYGTTLEKHKQIGNAVPPPLGKAIGLQLRKVM